MRCRECGQPLKEDKVRRIWHSEYHGLICEELPEGHYWVNNGHWTLERFSNGILCIETNKLILGPDDWKMVREEQRQPKCNIYNIPF